MSQIETPWKELGDRSKRRARETVTKTMSSFTELLAPGHGKELMEYTVDGIRNSKKVTEEQIPLSDTLISAVKNCANNNVRNQILSLVALNYTKTELLELIPGLTPAHIDAARKHARVVGPGLPLQVKPTPRDRLNMDKAQHFVLFMLQPDFMQVSY